MIKPSSKSNTATLVVIDGAGRPMGRLATEAALALRNKHQASFAPHLFPNVRVVIKNIDQIALTGRKRTDKLYWHFTGFPGGMRLIPFDKMFQRDPRLAVRRAVRGMLPKNRQRDKILKNLVLFRGEKA